MTRAETLVRTLLRGADIEIGGGRPQDIRIHDSGFYRRVLSQGSFGLGESYMDGWWDANALDVCLTKMLAADLETKVRKSPAALAVAALAKVSNRQSSTRAYNIGKVHYDIGNDLYERMLDARLVYTCGYWNPSTSSGQGAMTLDAAQEAKLDLVCRKIGLKKGDHVLDIGCGWGSFAKFAAERYGAQVTGITVSKEQLALGQRLCEGLPVTLRLQDYRIVEGEFDHVVSLGMIEHVGYRNYRSMMRVVRRVLKPEGLFLLHTIGGDRSVTHTDAWIDRYIFPDSMLPSAAQLARAAEGLFVMEDWHSFGADYDRTLMAWHANFTRRWNEIASRYDERFRRMWEFYLLASAATFRTRSNQLWQIVYSPGGVPGGYRSLR